MAIGTGQGETEAEGEVKLSTSNGDRVLSPIVAAVDISGVSPVFPIIFINELGRCPRDTLSPKCSVESHPFSEWREKTFARADGKEMSHIQTFRSGSPLDANLLVYDDITADSLDLWKVNNRVQHFGNDEFIS
jgi:hypothetical protein